MNKFVSALTGMLVILMTLLGPALPGQPERIRAAPPPDSGALSTGMAAPGDGAIRAAYLYSEDLATAQAFVDLLNANDFTATAIPIAEAEWPYTVFLPLVLRSQGNSAASEDSLRAAAVPDFSEYDLILIGPETAKGSVWSPEPGLVTAVVASGLPIVGIGNGGYAFFGELGLDIGSPQGTRATARSVQVRDFGDSQPFYSEPHAISIPGDQLLDLYQTAQDTVAIPLEEHLTQGVRVASLVGTDSYPILASGERYLLWGFHGSPSEMTTIGQELFLNALRFRVQNLNVPLRSRSFIPAPGIEQALLNALDATSGDGLHAYVQLHEPPTLAERAALESAEVTLLDFVHGTTYTAFVGKALNPNDTTLNSLVRWMGLIPATDKVDPKILEGNYEEWADNGDGTVNLLVTFFSDVVTPAAESILATRVISYSIHTNHQWAVVMNKTEIVPLSEEDAVYWIEEGPIPLLPINDEAREDLMVDEVQQAVITGPATPFYKGLDGSGVSVGIFDTGVNTPTFQHQDFAGRLLRTANDTNSHGSHVAGIVGASGSQSVANCPSGTCTDYELRGMAPNVSLAPYYGWTAARMDEAVNTYNIEVSNHSYVMTCGLYNTNARDIDRLVRGDLQNGSNSISSHFAVWAAANQGTGAQYCTTGTLPDGTTADPTTGPRGYYSILSPAKNQLTVGALNRNSNYDLRASSSRGPTWDGRLKPEVMGIGCEWSTDNDTDGYIFKCGTSMASPSVAGVTALVVQQYHQTYPSAGRPTPSLLKAILVQSADDLEHHPGQAGFSEYSWNDPDSGQPVIYHAGPDWATGYGVVNAQKAVALVRGRNLIEGTVSPGDTTDTYTVEIPEGRTEFKVTLTWDDEAGNPTLAVNTAQLVNDLDLTLEAPDGTIYRPWVLPALPRATSTYNASNQDTGVRDPITRTLHVLPAFRGVDRLNVVEQVGVTDPVEILPGTWTIRVNAFNLPNGNAQPYSLAGDFRSINIIEPQTGNYAEAGDPTNPNVILVAVEAENELNGDTSTLVDAEPGDFEVAIDGTPAPIINGAPVGDQFWLNVRPESNIYSAGSKYDLTVSLQGYGSDTETRAVLFTEREITDRAVILDTSGSMADYDKMAAAQNAARLFIDQSLIGDRVAVVEFDTGASTPYAITEVSSNPTTPELSAAKSAVDALLVGGRTAIGQGLLAGQDEVTAAPVDFSLVDVLVLLSDGMENEDPLYDTPAVKGVIEPTGTIIHTVAVGPSEAGHHALLEEISGDNGGRSYHVTESSVVLATAGDGVQVAATGEGLAAWPDTLSNRLGDTYKQIAEEVLHENRLYQYSDLSDPKAGIYTRTVSVPAGLKRITFALNWEEPNHLLSLRLRDPDGKLYEYDPQNNNFCRSDATHETCIIDAPTPGIWEMIIDFVETDRANEFVLWASARTAVSFQLFVGTPGRERTTHNDIHLVGFLHESGVPLPEQEVQVRIFDPVGETATTLILLDDGQNGDGKAGDGIYGGYFLAGEQPGAYAVRGMAKGEDRNGEPFTLYKNTNFHLRPRALYIHTWDTGKGIAYRNLLEKTSFTVDLAYSHVVPTLDLSKYSLVIVGPETGYLSNWEPAETIRAITNNEIPVLGLGEGGYAYFGKLGLEIGHGNGVHGSGTSIDWSRDTSSDDIWLYPYEINRPKEAMQLYSAASPRVDIYIGNQPTGVTTFGYNDNNRSYADLIMESNWYMLWGFDDGPAAMTNSGRQLFVNTAYRTKR